METIVCFITATILVCEPKKLDRERGDDEPIEILQEPPPSPPSLWPPTHGDWRFYCPGRNGAKCSVDYVR
jgi:hypothetical protein